MGELQMNRLYDIPLKRSCMYLRGNFPEDRLPEAPVQSEMHLRPGERLSADTYYGCFPCEPYLAHTTVRRIAACAEVSGRGSVCLCHCSTSSEISVIASAAFDCGCPETVRLQADLSDFSDGYLYIQAEAESNTHPGPDAADGARVAALWYEGSGESRETRIAVILCTFRREEYVKANLQLLAEACSSGGLREQLTVFCIDNGQTLTEVPEGVRLFQNPNCGGSGGYARGMLEACGSEEQFTHFWLMDDDICFDPCILRRAVTFLRCRADDRLCLAAGMFSFEQPTLQTEATAVFGGYSFTSNAGGLDFSEQDTLLRSTLQPSPHTYGGWWSLIMPAGNRLPMPFFIKLDDIEYGISEDREYVIMNGFGVWHEAFGKKANAWSEYYTVRNTLITQALHRELPHSAAKMMGVRLLKALAYGEPRCMEASLKGVEDFLAGPAFFRRTDPEANHNKVRERYGAPLTQDMSRADMLRAAAAHLLTPAGLQCVRLYLTAVSRLQREGGKARRYDWASLRARDFWESYLHMDQAHGDGNAVRQICPGSGSGSSDQRTAAPQALISVIIPVYNVSAYLARALASVCGQTYEALEILLVDDGSTDGSGQICDEWAGRDGRIRVIHRENGGVSAARNTGLRAARGSLIAFADADDWLEPGMYAALAALLEADGTADMAVCGYYDYPHGPDRPVIRGTGFAGSCGQEEAAAQFLSRNGYNVTVWNKLFRRGAVIRNGRGIAFPEKLSFGEDEVWLLRVLQNARRIVFLPEPLYHWRKREGSITQFSGITERERGLITAKKAALKLLPPDPAIRMLAEGRTWNDCFALKLQAYYTQDRDSFRRISAALAPMKKAWICSGDVPVLRKLKVLVLEMEMRLRLPVVFVRMTDGLKKESR